MSFAFVHSFAMSKSGAVRHAAEAFNYYWPQDLDDEYLVVWEGFEKVRWRYLKPAELVRRSAVPTLDSGCRAGQDCDFWLCLLMARVRFAHVHSVPF